jgi:hypothetical protein
MIGSGPGNRLASFLPFYGCSRKKFSSRGGCALH